MEPRVTRTYEDAILNPENGKVRYVYRTRFMVGDDGPFEVTIPKDEWTGQRVADEMRKVARELAILRTQTL